MVKVWAVVVAGMLGMAPTVSAVPSAAATTAAAGSPVVTLTGTALAIDGVPGPTAPPSTVDAERWVLEEANGGRHDLRFPSGARPALPSGTAVVVTGRVAGTRLDVITMVAVSSDEDLREASTVSGARDVLVILAEAQGPDAATAPSVAAKMSAARDWFSEVSYGAVSISATVTPWLPVPSIDCLDLSGLTADAEASAVAAGYAPATYDHVMIYFPHDSGCSAWAGWGEIGGNTTWINGYEATTIFIHELGHNLGLGHSRALACGSAEAPAVFGPVCPGAREYGDVFDTMGDTWLWAGSDWGLTGHFNAAHKWQLGWMQATTVDVTESGSHELAPFEVPTASVQALRIAFGGLTLWVEHRTAAGVDSLSAATYPALDQGVLVHVERSSVTDLLDMQPTTWFDFGDAVLVPGDTWVSPHGVELSVSAVGASGATVDVTMPHFEATCDGRATTIHGVGTIHGTDGDDVIVGSDGDDVIHAGEGNDVVCAGGGHDVVHPGPGDDVVRGGDEVDVLSYAFASAGVSASLATGVASGEGQDAFTGVEDLEGSPVDDQLTGDDGPNVITSFTGNDLLSGGGGRDVLRAGSGNDRLAGGEGDDELWGHNGTDVLSGMSGDDTLDGGPDSGSVDGDICVQGSGTGPAIGCGSTLMPVSAAAADIAADEGDSGGRVTTLEFVIPVPSDRDISYLARTRNGTASSPTDYRAIVDEVMVVPAGDTVGHVALSVAGDVVREPDESLWIDIRGSSSGKVLTSARVTIRNDDGSGPPVIAVSDVSVSEGTSISTPAVFTVSLNRAAATPVTVRYATVNGTARAPGDFTAKASTTLTFAPGEVSKPVTVQIKGDQLREVTEHFALTLSNPTGATVGDGQGDASILDDDSAVLPTVSVADVSVVEGSSGTTPAVFTVTLSAPATATVRVTYATLNGTAKAGSDFVAAPATVLTFSPGQVSKTVTVAVKGDRVVEASERFTIKLSAPVKASIADAQAVAIILNDD